MKRIGQISSQASASLKAQLTPLSCSTFPNFETAMEFGCDFVLLAEGNRLRLANSELGEKAALEIDFFEGSLRHRRHFGGGRNQDLAKAVGLNRNPKISILDATAGLGRDSFVMALIGATLKANEKNEVLVTLLQWAHLSALEKAQADQDWELVEVLERMRFRHRDTALDHESDQFDVVYLDPMFPERQKTAKVKKEMQILHQLLCEDQADDESLFAACIAAARSRLVIKRPLRAPAFADRSPQHQVRGKTVRYDLYVKQALPE